MKKVITSSATSFKGPLLASLSSERKRKRERTSRRGIRLWPGPVPVY